MGVIVVEFYEVIGLVWMEVMKFLFDEMVVVLIDGVSKEIFVVLIENFVVGDFVIFYVGYVFIKIDLEEVWCMFELLCELSIEG